MQEHKTNFISGFIVFAIIAGFFGYLYFAQSNKKDINSGIKDWEFEAIAPSDQTEFIVSNGKYVKQYIEATEETDNMVVAENAENAIEKNAEGIDEISNWIGRIEAINENSIECTCANVHLNLYFDDKNPQKITELKVGDVIKFSGKKQIFGAESENNVNDVSLGLDMDFKLLDLKLIEVE